LKKRQPNRLAVLPWAMVVAGRSVNNVGIKRKLNCLLGFMY